MGERKVMNKYFPPDFDHTKIPKQAKEQKQKIVERFVVRMMLPMSVRCMTCGEYMYKGKKFNSRKENVEGPEGDYLGIQIFRFYFKCTSCSAEFTVKTDPKNMDYVVEGGAKANFELWKEEAKEKEELASEKTEGEKYDTMKQLENKTEESKRAMDILDALDEIRTQNARAASVGIDDVLESRQRALEKKNAAAEGALDDEDGLEAARAFAAGRAKRLRDDEEAHSTLLTGGGTGGVGLGMGGAGGASSRLTASSSSKAAAKKPKLPIGIAIQPRSTAAASAAAGSSGHSAAASAIGSGSGGGGGGGSGQVGSAGAGSSAGRAAGGATSGQGEEDEDEAGSGGGLLGLGAYDSSGSGSGSGGEGQ